MEDKIETIERILDYMHLEVGLGRVGTQKRLSKLELEDLEKVERTTRDYSEMFRGMSGQEAIRTANRLIVYLRALTRDHKKVDPVNLEVECLMEPERLEFYKEDYKD